MALSDEEVDTKELEMLYRIGEERAVSREEIDHLLVHSADTEFISPGSVLEKIACLYDFALIAWADGKIDPAEKQLLQKFCIRFGFQEENIDTICQFLLDEAQQDTPKEKILSTVSKNL